MRGVCGVCAVYAMRAVRVKERMWRRSVCVLVLCVCVCVYGEERSRFELRC